MDLRYHQRGRSYERDVEDGLSDAIPHVALLSPVGLVRRL
jgi:hypothetical protein